MDTAAIDVLEKKISTNILTKKNSKKAGFAQEKRKDRKEIYVKDIYKEP